MAEQDDVRRVHRHVDEVGGEERDREAEHLARRDLDASLAQAVEQALLAQHAVEQHGVERDAERGRGHVPRGQEEDALSAEDEEEDDDQPQARRQHVLPEEDGARPREDGEHAHQEAVERLERREHDEDQEDRDRPVVADQRARQHALEAVDEHEREQADGRHRPDGQDDRPEELLVLPLLVVDGDEARDRPVEAERGEARAEADEGECVGERAVVGLRQVADDQDLDDEVDAERHHPPDQEQARAADLPSRGGLPGGGDRFARRGGGDGSFHTDVALGHVRGECIPAGSRPPLSRASAS